MDAQGTAILPDRALDRIDPARFKLIELMVLAVAERGAPMDYDAIRERLARRGRFTSAMSLQKAWHGLPPLRKNAQGELELVPALDPYVWPQLVRRVEEHLGLVQRPARTSQEKPTIDVESPITFKELRTAFEAGVPFSLSSGRRLALVIESAGRPLEAGEIEARLKDLGERFSLPSLKTYARRRDSAVRPTAEGRWTADLNAPTLREARRVVREICRRKQAEEELRARQRAWNEGWVQRERAKERDEEERWRASEKRFLCTCWAGDWLVTACVLDPDRRAITDFGDADALRAEIERCGVLLGLDPRADLERLGVAAGERQLIDLRPPVKTRKLNRAGRILAVTPKLILRSTIGRSDSPGDPRTLARWVRAGDMGKIRRRLASDLKALHALHAYGRLHGYVRLRWGFLNETLPVAWGAPYHSRLAWILKHAYVNSQQLDVVLYGAPGWTDPWSRAQRVEVVRVDEWDVHLRRLDRGDECVLPVADVVAVRDAVLEEVQR